MSLPYRRAAAAALLVLTAATAACTVTPLRAAPLADPIEPCVDFYAYANQDWLARATLPEDRARWGADEEIEARNDTLLAAVLRDAARAGAPHGSLRQKVGDLYASALDSARVEALGIEPLRAELDAIEAVRTPAELVRLLFGVHARGLPLLFLPVVDTDMQDSGRYLLYLLQGGLALPDPADYARPDAEAAELRRDYRAHAERVLRRLGASDGEAAAGADAVLAIETRLAGASLGPLELRDPANFYRLLSPAEAERITPGLPWSAYGEAAGARPARLSFPHERFFREVDAMTREVPLEHWKAYLRLHLADALAPHLGGGLAEEHFDFFERRLNGTARMPSREVRAQRSVEGALGLALGQLYAERAFPPESRDRVLAMFERLRGGLRARLERSPWMSPETRARALEKLAAMRPKIGYPAVAETYAELRIERGDYLGNLLRARAWEARRDLARSGAAVDRDEWRVLPHSVNAFYNPLQNEVIFPAGILQPPYFVATGDDAANYGGLGAILGHEIVHGFDDQGSQFDASGRLADWWSAEDREEFERRIQGLVRQFDAFVAVDTLHVDGKLTLGENLADLGGVQIALDALRLALRESGAGPAAAAEAERRFFLSYAQAWRRLERPEALATSLRTDPHAPARLRVIGPLSHLPAFAAAFGCRAGDPMVRPLADRVEVW